MIYIQKGQEPASLTDYRRSDPLAYFDGFHQRYKILQLASASKGLSTKKKVPVRAGTT